jgi:hypothetical protein
VGSELGPARAVPELVRWEWPGAESEPNFEASRSLSQSRSRQWDADRG